MPRISIPLLRKIATGSCLMVLIASSMLVGHETPASAAQTTVGILCESEDFGVALCPLNGLASITSFKLGRIFSDASCTIEKEAVVSSPDTGMAQIGRQGPFQNDSLRITGGCRALFQVTVSPAIEVRQVNCGSVNFQAAVCPLGDPANPTPIRGVVAASRASRNGCQANKDVFITPERNLGVTNGCRGTFNVIL